MNLFIGTSGYSYKHWAKGVFYPQGLPSNKWLEFYCERFNAVELNVTFYRLVKQSTFEGWMKRTPKDFSFAVKGSRFITHVKRLKAVEEPLKKFGASLIPLMKKTKCVLWQLPPGFKADPERLKFFCSLLAKSRVLKKTRHVFEFRHETWFTEETCGILKQFNYGLCFAASPKKIGEEVLTADFVYLRFHGGSSLYASNYSDEQLKTWARKVKEWKPKIGQVFAFFNNDNYGFAPPNAMRLRDFLTRNSSDHIGV